MFSCKSGNSIWVGVSKYIEEGSLPSEPRFSALARSAEQRVGDFTTQDTLSHQMVTQANKKAEAFRRGQRGASGTHVSSKR